MRATALLFLFGAGCIPRLYTEVATSNGLDWEAPENGWPVAAPPAELEGQGWDVGDTPMDFRLVDQFGDEVSLWQFYGQVVLVDISTMWCAPCQELATHTTETFEDYEAEGFMYLTVLQENVEGEEPGPEGLTEWSEAFEITAPVLDDGTKEATGTAIQQGQFPAVLVVGRDMKVVERVNPVSDEAVRAAIEAQL